MEEHFTSKGAKYTKKYKPLKIVEIKEEQTKTDERNTTLKYMNLYGYEKVRGYVWHFLELKNNPCEMNYVLDEFDKKSNKEYKNINTELVRLYCDEGKNISEIGSLMNRTAGSIATELENSGIIERKQLARGYIEYLNGDDYMRNKEISELKRKEKREMSMFKIPKRRKDRVVKPLRIAVNENTKVFEFMEIKDQTLILNNDNKKEEI